jgi:arylsulfatase A-like enzyme
MKTSRMVLPLALLPLAGEQVVAQQRPNIVFIVADQWRGDALGLLGREAVQTPNLDALARGGVCFTQAVSSYPVSSPARAMLMTGMYPHRTGVPANCNSELTPHSEGMRQDAVCWSDVLSRVGYETAYFGKWHLDSPIKPYVATYNNKGAVAWNEWTSPARRHGFRRWIAYGTYDNHLKPMFWRTNDGRDDWKFVDEWEPQYDADNAIEYIRGGGKLRDAAKPFVMVVSVNPPHTGYDLVPERYKTLYRNLNVDSIAASRPDVMASSTKNRDFFRSSLSDYYACMTGVDEQVGRIVSALKDAGLWENTLLVFTSDHGDCMGMHDVQGKNVFYDEAMRVPLIVSWPGTIKPRRDDRTLIAFADLGPTMLHLAGLKAQIPATTQTFDLADAVTGRKGASTPRFQPYFRLWPDNSPQGVRGLRDGRYTYVVSRGMTWDGHRSEASGRMAEWLFDRQTDPYEVHDVAAANPALCKKYRRLLHKFLKQQGDMFYREMQEGK